MATIGNRQNPNIAAQDRFNLRRGDGPYQWAQAFPGSTVPTPFWAVRIGCNLGYHGAGSPLARMAIWAGSPPTNRRAQTEWFDTYEFSGPSTGLLLEHRADLDTAVILQANQVFNLGIAVQAHANEQMYAQRSDSLTQRAWSRADVSGPTDPFGTPDAGIGDQSFESGFAFWLEGQFNTAPSVPADVQINGVSIPSGSTGLSIVDTTPTITGLFRDVDEVLKDGSREVFSIGEADKLNQVHVVVRNAMNNAIVWQHGPAPVSSGEQAARQFSVTTGSLGAGTYKLETRVSDLGGAWSGVSSHRFTVLAATVTTSGPPTGKITDTTPDTFGFTFTSSGSESTSQARVRLKRNGVVFATSPAIGKVVAPNAVSTVTWAQTAFSAIPYTGVITYEVQARYGASNTWTDWSLGAAFTINARPNTPSNLSPNGGSFGAYPLIEVTITDPDDESATLSPTIEVTRPDGSIVTYTGSVIYAGDNRWRLQTTAATNTMYGTYKYRSRAEDASGAVGLWSGYATYVYADVPDVVITGITPETGGIVTASGPTISWTTEGSATPSSTDQRKRRILIYRAGSYDTPYYQSSWVTTTSTSHTVNGVLLKQGDWVAYVGVENSLGVQGQSSSFVFTVAFTPPPTVTGVGVQPVPNINDYPGEPSAVLVTWDESDVDDFDRYEIARENASGILDTIGLIENKAQTSFTDHVPPAGENTYSVRQVRVENGDEVVSLDALATTHIAINVPVILTDVLTGESVALKSVQVGDIKLDLVTDVVEYHVRRRAPVERRGIEEYYRATLAGNIHATPDNAPDPDDQYDTLDALAKARVASDGNRHPRIVCLRTNERRKNRFFGGLQSLSVTPGRLVGAKAFSYVFTERDYSEAVTGEVAP